ncbi:hypothetical protein TNCV_1677061 [Trichonephila clavipes]|nr:hypothetical protein TNCV_1677061 [Trichonephila clavipes]
MSSSLGSLKTFPVNRADERLISTGSMPSRWCRVVVRKERCQGIAMCSRGMMALERDKEWTKPRVERNG